MSKLVKKSKKSSNAETAYRSASEIKKAIFETKFTSLSPESDSSSVVKLFNSLKKLKKELAKYNFTNR